MYKVELKEIVKIGVPTLISWFGHTLYGVTDNIMVGKILGSEALGVSGIATSLYYIFLVFGLGSANIIVALLSEAYAKNKYKTTKIMQNGLMFSVIIGIFISILIVILGKILIPLFNSQPILNEPAIIFLTILAPAPIFAMIFTSFEKLTESLSKAKYATYSVIICNIINVCLNYSLLTGSFGFPNLGVHGAAIATLFGNFLESIIIIAFCFYDDTIRGLLRFKKKFISFIRLKYIAKLGIPGGVFALAEMSLYSVGGFIASKASVYDIAAHQLISWCLSVILAPIFGFGVAVTVRIAYNNSLKRNALAYRIGIYSIVISAIYILIVLLPVWIFGHELAKLLLKGEGNDIITINLITSTLLIILFAEIFDAIQLMGIAVLRGFKDTQVPLIFGIISYWVIAIPLGYYFGAVMKMGVMGVWLGIAIGVSFQALFVLIRLIKRFKPKIVK